MSASVSSWYVVQTQRRRERWAAENILRSGGECYLPETIEVVRTVSKGVTTRHFVARPLFPAYLFAQTPSDSWQRLLRTFGVVDVLLGAGGRPKTIDVETIQRLRAAEVDGKVVLPSRKFQRGQAVLVKEGAYAGYQGLVNGYSGSDRVRLLIDYMERRVPFLVEESKLDAA